jgi:hypothetical protein
MAFSQANVTYDVKSSARTPTGVKNIVKLTFGNGVITYTTAAAVPIVKGKLGCPNWIKSISILEDTVSSGYIWQPDMSLANLGSARLVGFHANYDDTVDSGLLGITNNLAIVAQEVWVEVEGY